MRFCSVINCIDGRVQLPVIRFLQQRFKADHVDSITEVGPNLILAKRDDPEAVRSILKKLKVSIVNHDSVGVAVAGHDGCAGNPASEAEQIEHLKVATQVLQEHCKGVEVIGLWVNDKWGVREIT